MEIILISIALAMDAFAVSVVSGGTLRKHHIGRALTMGAWFGGFQAAMPFLGWWGGEKLRSYICCVDHWLAFGLLVFLGCKMIYESSRIKSVEQAADPFSAKVLLMLSIATSIDALAIGVVLSINQIPILLPIIMIGGITFLVCSGGVCLGVAGAHFFERKMEVIGGLILIAIGIKILASDLLQ